MNHEWITYSSKSLHVDFRIIMTDLTLPISTVFDQATVWPRWRDSTRHENPPPVCQQQMCPLGHKQIKKVFLLARAGPPIQLLPFRPFGFSFTAPATLSEMNLKITNQRPEYNTDMHPPTPIKPPVSCWEPLVGMFTVWRVNSLILSGMFPLGGAV